MPTTKTLTAIEQKQAKYDSICTDERQTLAEMRRLQWRLRYEIPQAKAQAKEELDAAASQPQRDEFAALAMALTARDRQLAELGRQRTRPIWEPA